MAFNAAAVKEYFLSIGFAKVGIASVEPFDGFAKELNERGGAYQAWVGNAKPSQMVRNTLQYYRLDPSRRAASVENWNQPIWWPLFLLVAAAMGVAGVAWRQVRRRELAVVVTQHDGMADAARSTETSAT